MWYSMQMSIFAMPPPHASTYPIQVLFGFQNVQCLVAAVVVVVVLLLLLPMLVHLRIEKNFQLSLMLNVVIFKDVFVPYISVIYILRL